MNKTMAPRLPRVRMSVLFLEAVGEEGRAAFSLMAEMSQLQDRGQTSSSKMW